MGVLVYASVIFHQSRKGTLYKDTKAIIVSDASPSQYPLAAKLQDAHSGSESGSSTPKPYDTNAYGAPQQKQQQYVQYSQQNNSQAGHELQSR